MSRGRRADRAQEQKADGRLVPAVTYVSSTDVDRLEKMLRDAVFRKVRTGVSEARGLKEAFTKFDLNGSGSVDYKEFKQAMLRFGLEVSEGAQAERQRGGIADDQLRALFDRYDASGARILLSHRDDTAATLPRDGRRRPFAHAA